MSSSLYPPFLYTNKRALDAASKANTFADYLFYDTGKLTDTEYQFLLDQNTVEGAVLVVHPSRKQDMGILKYTDFSALRAGKGEMLQRFSIAGVGSSDVGAAALARTFADHYGEPVGAIVAGYGIADLLSEALGGWFVLGGINRALSVVYDTMTKTNGKHGLTNGNATQAPLKNNPDSKTLFDLFRDADRHILSVGGHSKGSLSIALVMSALVAANERDAVARAKESEIVTVGSVVSLPPGFDKVRQFIGNIDALGAINSRSNVDHIAVYHASHHLNTTIPFHLDLMSELSKSETCKDAA